jgi:antirestriction protein
MVRVYVGTYAKYNAGSLKGAWLDLEKYSDKDDFIAACNALHNDEVDPELMFQDHEDIPKGMIGESYIREDVWGWLAMDEDDRELLTVYRQINQDADLDDARDHFWGRAGSPKAFAEEYAEQGGMTEKIPQELLYCIDWQAYADSLDNEGWYFIQTEVGKDYWIFNP